MSLIDNQLGSPSLKPSVPTGVKCSKAVQLIDTTCDRMVLQQAASRCDALRLIITVLRSIYIASRSVHNKLRSHKNKSRFIYNTYTNLYVVMQVNAATKLLLKVYQ